MKHYIDTKNKVWGLDETQSELIPSGAVEIPQSYSFDQYPYLSLVNGSIVYDQSKHDADRDAASIAACKAKAQQLLQITDWSTLTDVIIGSPKLVNQSDFIAYRNAIRALAVNPEPNPTWPAFPTEQWS